MSKRTREERGLALALAISRDSPSSAALQIRQSIVEPVPVPAGYDAQM
jgi:hypothetical protein